jgi:hypothetical protein
MYKRHSLYIKYTSIIKIRIAIVGIVLFLNNKMSSNNKNNTQKIIQDQSEKIARLEKAFRGFFVLILEFLFIYNLSLLPFI